MEIFNHLTLLSGVDPGFPVGGGANHPGGPPTYEIAKFSKNCMKLRKLRAIGALGMPPPKSANGCVCDLVNDEDFRLWNICFLP